MPLEVSNVLYHARLQEITIYMYVYVKPRVKTEIDLHFITTAPAKSVLKKENNQIEITENSFIFLTNLSLTFRRLVGTGSRSAPLSSGLSVFVFSSSEDGRMCILSLCL